MNITESIASALSGIFSNKMRSILTMFGIIVGIASVIMIVSIGQGVKASMTRQFEEMGMDVISIRMNDEAESLEDGDYLTKDDVETLKKYDELTAVSTFANAYMSGAITLLDGDSTRDVQFYGTDDDFFKVEKHDITSGRYILPQDIESAAMVAMIDADLALAVFGRTDVIGQSLEIQTYWNSAELQIIGIIESDQQTQMMAMYNMSFVYMPMTTFETLFWSDDTVASIDMKAADANEIGRIGNNVIRLVELSHGNAGENKYRISSVADNMSEVDTVLTMFTLFLGFVAGISLLVGGIGVMNIMLVSVTERTREIGIRKSLGATAGNIQLQFLIEAVILTALGGAIGILLGLGGGTVLGTFAAGLFGEPITPVLTMGSVVLVVTISAAIGIIFGVYPAAQAAKLDPIEALRFES